MGVSEANEKSSREVCKVREVLKTMRSLRLKILWRAYVHDPERFSATMEGDGGAEGKAAGDCCEPVVQAGFLRSGNFGRFPPQAVDVSGFGR